MFLMTMYLTRLHVVARRSFRASNQILTHSLIVIRDAAGPMCRPRIMSISTIARNRR